MVSKTAFQIYLARYKHPRSSPSYQTQRHDLNHKNSLCIKILLGTFQLTIYHFNIQQHLKSIQFKENIFGLNAGTTAENNRYLSKIEKTEKEQQNKNVYREMPLQWKQCTCHIDFNWRQLNKCQRIFSSERYKSKSPVNGAQLAFNPEYTFKMNSFSTFPSLKHPQLI